MLRLWSLTLVTTVAVVLAREAVYGSGSSLSASPLRGYVLLSAFTGGVALAFSRPFLLVLVPYLTVLFGDLNRQKSGGSRRSIDWVPPACYLGAFALAFTLTISGFPRAIATLIHRSEWLVDPVGGLIVMGWGLLTIVGVLPPGPVRIPPPVWSPVVGAGSVGVLGATIGALVYHDLDPQYDSVFFFTANAVADSHAPFTVAVFTTGLGLTYLAAGGVAAALVFRSRWGRMALLVGRTVAGIATALIGLAAVTHRFGAIRGVLF